MFSRTTLVTEGSGSPYRLQRDARKFPSPCSSEWDVFLTLLVSQNPLLTAYDNNSNNFKPGIVSYSFLSSLLKNASQHEPILKYTNVAKINWAVLRDISGGTTRRKKLHFTYLFWFCQTTRSFAVVITSWNFFTQWTRIKEVDSSC